MLNEVVSAGDFTVINVQIHLMSGVFDGLIEEVESAQEVGLIKMPTGQRDNHLFDLNRNHVAAREFRHIEHRAGVLKNNVLEWVIFGDFLDDFGIKIVFGIFGFPIAERVTVGVI